MYVSKRFAALLIIIIIKDFGDQPLQRLGFKILNAQCHPRKGSANILPMYIGKLI